MATIEMFTQHRAPQSFLDSGLRQGWGLFAGWKAYRAFSALSALSDAELAAKGLGRADIAREAARSAGLSAA